MSRISNDPGTEAEALDIYEPEDEEETELDRMLCYHELDMDDYSRMSNNQRSNLWWNYRMFGGQPRRRQL